jgi:hypothetical protein
MPSNQTKFNETMIALLDNIVQPDVSLPCGCDPCDDAIGTSPYASVACDHVFECRRHLQQVALLSRLRELLLQDQETEIGVSPLVPPRPPARPTGRFPGIL